MHSIQFSSKFSLDFWAFLQEYKDRVCTALRGRMIIVPAGYSITLSPSELNERSFPSNRRCGSVETCRKAAGVPLSRSERESAEQFFHGYTMSTLSLRNIVKTYPGASEPTVHGFNLEIADKEFIVLVGPSGCGKSTTLRMVAGLEEISKGELYIDGKLVNDVEPKDRDIAMVFQSYALYPHMTVRENMEFPLKLKKVPKEEIQQRVDQAAEILGITQYLDRKPKALSGGQRQRLSIARALTRKAPSISLTTASPPWTLDRRRPAEGPGQGYRPGHGAVGGPAGRAPLCTPSRSLWLDRGAWVGKAPTKSC